MTNFTFILSTGAQQVTATKYAQAPKSPPFAATLDGKPADAWTTEGRGSAYIYFRQDGVLHYAKVLPADTLAARTSLVIESEGYAPKVAEPTKPRNRTRRVVKS